MVLELNNQLTSYLTECTRYLNLDITRVVVSIKRTLVCPKEELWDHQGRVRENTQEGEDIQGVSKEEPGKKVKC